MRVLLLSPSTGLGGGIERYVSTLECAFDNHGVEAERLDLLDGTRSATPRRKIEFLRAARRALGQFDEPTAVVMAHRDLLPLCPFLERVPSYAGTSVILHGTDAWTSRRSYRTRLLARPRVRAVAVSNFTAGSLVTRSPASILPPGLSHEWFGRLASAQPTRTGRLDVLTVFRLDDWRDKGVPTLLTALRQVDDPRLHLTVCGSLPLPDDLQEVIRREPRTELLVAPSDSELAERFASAFAFVLATRTRPGSSASGEGFGMVLLEAQVAGVPVIAPAHGGGGDAFQEGLTGLSPRDESAGALAHQLRRLLDEPGLRDGLAARARDWSRSRFDPDAHARRVIEVLLGGEAMQSGRRNGLGAGSMLLDR